MNKFTKKLPTKEGYYWWTNFGEHTPTVVRVTRDYSSRALYADNEEYSFKVKKKSIPKKDKDPEMKKDGHYFGEEMWCYIPVPLMGKKKIKEDWY